MRWRSTLKPRRRIHRPKTQRHRRTPPSHISPISPRHQPARSSPPRRRSRPPTAPPPHQSAVQTPPHKTRSSPPTQLNAHTSPPELPPPPSEKLDRRTRRHQYASPPTLQRTADSDAQPQHDHAPSWGYDLLAPRKGSRYLLWQPGPVPLPLLDPTATCARFGAFATHDAGGSPSHVDH